MKYIVFGLGTFGSSLAEKLTNHGHEVIGVDKRMEKVDLLKEKITHTICMDATDELSVSGLPLDDTDVVIVTIGEDEGANIMVTALLKNLNVKRLISRALNNLHEKVLKAIGVHEIVHPEEETAERWSKKLCLSNVIDSFELSDNYSIVEIKAPNDFFGKSLKELDLRKKHNLIILTTLIPDNSVEFPDIQLNRQSSGVATPETIVGKNEILVAFGKNEDINKFLK